MNLLAPVSTIMTKDLITLGPEDNLKKVQEIFESKNIHHLPVVDKGQLTGMLSKSDYLFFRKGFVNTDSENELDQMRLKTSKVKEVMTNRLAKLEPQDRIQAAVEVFKENLFHAIPIVEDGYLRGIVTTLDIINHLSRDISNSEQTV